MAQPHKGETGGRGPEFFHRRQTVLTTTNIPSSFGENGGKRFTFLDTSVSLPGVTKPREGFHSKVLIEIEGLHTWTVTDLYKGKPMKVMIGRIDQIIYQDEVHPYISSVEANVTDIHSAELSYSETDKAWKLTIKEKSAADKLQERATRAVGNLARSLQPRRNRWRYDGDGIDDFEDL